MSAKSVESLGKTKRVHITERWFNMTDNINVFKNLRIGLNYSSVKSSGEDAISLETGKKYGFNQVIAITVEEAEWLLTTLPEYIKMFENEPEHRIKKLIKEINNSEQHSVGWIADELEDILQDLTE